VQKHLELAEAQAAQGRLDIGKFADSFAASKITLSTATHTNPDANNTIITASST